MTLIHWNAEEGEARAVLLQRFGFEVAFIPPQSPPSFKLIRATAPDVFLIDLTRLPSFGRDVAIALRQFKATRSVPIVFAGGPPEKVVLIRERLPDAGYAEWVRIAPAIRHAIAHRPAAPVVPPALKGYTDAPLAQRLGIKPGRSVALLHAPDGFEALFEDVPDVEFRVRSREPADIVVLFVKSQEQLEVGFQRSVWAMAEGGKLWVAYPKKASGVQTDLTQASIREFGMALGLVDFKVCSIDKTWTGFCFARKKVARTLRTCSR